MSKLANFKKKNGVKKLTPKQKKATSGGWNWTSWGGNRPPSQTISIWQHYR